MANIVYVPLDERPCNYKYPQQLSKMTDLNMVVPPYDVLGKKKTPADYQRLLNWLEDVAAEANYLIISIDMLVYGGIVPSRMHNITTEKCLNRLRILSQLKETYPKLKIYAYDLIMRTPAYNNSDEEPDYYEVHGLDIFKLGWLTDKKDQDMLDSEEEEQLQRIKQSLPIDVKEDYLNRRTTNAQVTNSVIDLVDQNIIDYLIIPLDDNAEYGFTSIEQRQLMHDIDRRNLLDVVNVYPGADDIGCTLFSRVFCDVKQHQPEVFLRYSSTHGPFMIPKYEDRSLGESIKSHMTAAGGVIVFDEKENDFILMVNASPTGPESMAAADTPLEKRHHDYFTESNIREFAMAIKYYLGKNKHVALADVAFGNGGDHSLLQLLTKQSILHQLIAYAGWNTNGNTMGTVIAHAIIATYYQTQDTHNRQEQHDRSFFYARLIEDWGYQSIVRKRISEKLPDLGVTVRDLGEEYCNIVQLVGEALDQFLHDTLQSMSPYNIHITNVDLPWKRMFEVSFDIELEE